MPSVLLTVLAINPARSAVGLTMFPTSLSDA